MTDPLKRSRRARNAEFSAGVILLRREGALWRVLVLRAYGYWDFPKGRVESEEEPWAAAVRELREETGIASPTRPWGESYYETEAYSRGKVARYYVARTDSTEVTLSWEHHEARWLSFGDARTLLVPRLQKALDWAAQRAAQSEHG